MPPESGRLTTHAFRHSFRTCLNQTGVPIDSAKAKRSSLATTMDTYGTMLDAELAPASGRC